MIQAIETTYQGYRFRSRLEARWAVFFDALGMEWQYEKEGYNLGQEGYYLPDFWLPYESGEPGWGHWVEIKPLAPTDSECRKLAALAKLSGHRTYCCAGDPGNCDIDVEKDGRRLPFPAPIFSSNGLREGILAARSARFDHREAP
jgi:hypothetical protein